MRFRASAPTTGAASWSAAPPMPMRGNLRRQLGVTLMEVLITVVVLALGVLSLIALQLVSKRTISDADTRSLAAQASYDILERIRANRGSTATYLTAAGTAGIGGGQQGSEPTPNCRTGNCTASQLATYDMWQFEQILDGASETVGGAATGGLTNARACLTGPIGPGVYTLAIVWRSTLPLPDSGTSITACGDDLTDAGGSYLYGSDAECSAAFGKSATVTGDRDCFRRVSVISAYVS